MTPGPLRVLVVSREYWPHLFSDVASRTVRMAEGVSRAGLQVEVLTPRYESTWPDLLSHREITVHRPALAPRSDWTMGRYLKSLENWLREHLPRFDVIYIADVREEAAVAVELGRKLGIGTIIHFSGSSATGASRRAAHPVAGTTHDVWSSISLRFRRRVQSALRNCDAVVVSRASAHQTLVAMGIQKQRIHRIEPGVWSGKGLAGRDSTQRLLSRQCLASANGDLATDRDSMVVLSIGAMNDASGVWGLAQTIPAIVDLWPDLRFWLIGDGPLRNDLHRFFKHHGVRQNVAMPGTFVDFSDLMMAADLYHQPSASDGLEDFVWAAISCALPMVIADSVETRMILGPCDDCVGWCSEGDVPSIHQATRRVIQNLTAYQQAAERLRKSQLLRSNYDDAIRSYVNLLHQVSTKSS